MGPFMVGSVVVRVRTCELKGIQRSLNIFPAKLTAMRLFADQGSYIKIIAKCSTESESLPACS